MESEVLIPSPAHSLFSLILEPSPQGWSLTQGVAVWAQQQVLKYFLETTQES